MKENKKDIKLEKQEIEETKKNINIKKILKYFCIVILVAVVCSVFFFLGMMFSEKSNDNLDMENKNDLEEDDLEKDDLEDEDTDIPVLTKDSDIVKYLFDVFREDTDDSLNYAKDKMNTDMGVRLRIAYTLFDDSDFEEIRCGDLSTAHYSASDEGFTAFHYCGTVFYEELGDKAYQYWYDGDGVNFDKEMKDEKTKGFAASELEKNYKKLFGQNAKYENKSFGLFAYSTTIAYYDSKTDNYAVFTNVGGMEVYMGYTQTLESIEQVESKLVLNTTMTASDEEYESYNISYTFEYEKETGNYVFVNREEK